MRLALVSQRIFNTKHFRIVQRSSKSTHPICFLSQYSSSSSHITVHHHQGQKLSFVEVEQDIATLQHRIREAYTYDLKPFLIVKSNDLLVQESIRMLWMSQWNAAISLRVTLETLMRFTQVRFRTSR